MQLSKIKISGFKSFVDPTSINLPGNLVAIVGPNGCGKSNIIDAVTWVMGESSPKYLRGEALTDVIFNGSTSRKPVGQASVELIFDNSDGSILGEYAKFSEVSVKRVINRESDSSYYLNGVRCRKRDVVDIFLGTGLGPRSYSIIGQNMITRVIEAKPDELRTYLEEAAGISKYKERRHETELRIGHTNENLARVNDLRAELDKQLSHLKHQANVAEKFKVLKQQERVLRAELYGIQWRSLDSQMVEFTLNIQREETALEARNSELIGTDKEIEQMRNEQRAAQDAFQEVQRKYYEVGNEITRIEQDILHHQEKQRQWENDLAQVNGDWQSFKDQIDEAQDNIKDFDQDIENIEPKLRAMKQEAENSQDNLDDAEEDMHSWQARWDEFNQTYSKIMQTAQVEKTRIQHVEQKIALLQKRQTQLQQEESRFNFSDLNKEIEEFSRQSLEVTSALQTQTAALFELKNEMSIMQSAQQDASTQLDLVRNEVQKLSGQQASLQALQQTALGEKNPSAPWIAKYQLGSKPRLAQQIEVEKAYELAVEKVLGSSLQAICVDKFDEVLPHLADFKSGNLCVFSSDQSAQDNQSKKGTLLLEKIKSPWPLDSLMAGVYVADTLDEALALSEKLAAHESVITQDGVWLSPTWLKVLREEDPAAGIFQRGKELKQLALDIKRLQAEQSELEINIKDRREKLQKMEQQRDQLQQSVNQQQNQSAQINAQQKMKQERLVELKVQSERFLREKNESANQLQQGQDELVKARTAWQQALTEAQEQDKKRDSLIKERDKSRHELQHLREATDEKKDEMHELEIRLQTSKSQRNSLSQTILRLQNQLTALTERKTLIETELAAMPALDAVKESLSKTLDKHGALESELHTARVAVESLEEEFRKLDEKRHVIDRDINRIRNTLESLRVEWQGLKVKSETILEQIKETEFTLENILKELPPDIQASEWQGKLDQTVQRINRLGPINLVAIDEYSTCLERKEYLDKQVEDLQSGLNTLQDAIAKIDKETKTRFKETFDKVNERFQELFPTVFGGGKAYLELNSDNLLEAGITIMACPPGKRNSSIYLLSGGEKSLTAISLIFSIFHLNPAPFCLLDEVDAALDDANVLRFTRLVKVMATKTKFLFISHNKITIEMAEHLIGVTMNEPGVSRLVSVDVEKAMSLAGS